MVLTAKQTYLDEECIMGSIFTDKMFESTSIGETANGAKTFTRTESSLVDFFAQAAAMRDKPGQALDLFKKAFAEDNEKAVKLLFYIRDVRGGQGERAIFRTCLNWLQVNKNEIFKNIVKYVPRYYGRWDDVFIDDKECYRLIKMQLHLDGKTSTPSLLAKWLPTINTKNKATKKKAVKMAKGLGLGEIEYRKIVRDIRKKINTVESLMSAGKWGDIVYNSVPSNANKKYRTAFYNHDEDRYTTYLEDVEKGDKKINVGNLYPYEIYNAVNDNYSKSLDVMWDNLPDYTKGKNAIVVADTSGSMYGRPISVSVSLALYFAERNKGIFKDCFITFSDKPVLQVVKGVSLFDKMQSIQHGDWGFNTNIQATFDLVLDTIRNNHIPDEEVPETMYIISDMEFDNCGVSTNLEVIRQKYKQYDVKCPNLVFWNVNASGSNLPAKHDERGFTMVSGCSPVVFSMAVEGKTARELMMDVVNSDRYKDITI